MLLCEDAITTFLLQLRSRGAFSTYVFFGFEKKRLGFHFFKLVLGKLNSGCQLSVDLHSSSIVRIAGAWSLLCSLMSHDRGEAVEWWLNIAIDSYCLPSEYESLVLY